MKIHSAASLCGSGARAVLRPNGIRTPASRPPTSLRASAPLKDWFHSKAPQEGVQLELMQSSIADGAGLKATVGVSKGQVKCTHMHTCDAQYVFQYILQL